MEFFGFIWDFENRGFLFYYGIFYRILGWNSENHLAFLALPLLCRSCQMAGFISSNLVLNEFKSNSVFQLQSNPVGSDIQGCDYYVVQLGQ